MADTRQPPQPVERRLPTPDISPPQGTYMGPHARSNIAAAVNLPKGDTALAPYHPFWTIPIPQDRGTLPETFSPLSPPPTKEVQHIQFASASLAPTEDIGGPATSETLRLVPAIPMRSPGPRPSVRSFSRASLLCRELKYVQPPHSDQCEAKPVHDHGPLPSPYPGRGPDPHLTTHFHTSPSEEFTQPWLAP